jgi:plastocyanin
VKRYLIASIVTGAAILAAPAAASAVTITVEPAPFSNSFAPANSTLDLGGGSFDWEWGAGGVGTEEPHNVVQGDAFAPRKPLFDSGEAVTDRPGGFSVTASAGSFPYYCDVHLGMVGKVAVRPVGEPKGKAAKLSWASAETTTGNRFDVRYRAGKKWKLWKKKTKKTGGKFGRKGKPVKLGRKAVKVQARSRAGKARSGWSPTLKLAR